MPEEAIRPVKTCAIIITSASEGEGGYVFTPFVYLFRVRTPPGKSLKLLEFNSYPGMSWNMLKNQIELLKTP